MIRRRERDIETSDPAIPKVVSYYAFEMGVITHWQDAITSVCEDGVACLSSEVDILDDLSMAGEEAF